MADLNLRNIDPALRSALKAEAAACGKGLIEYSIEILAGRHESQKVAVPASPAPVAQPVIKHEDPQPVYGDWDTPPQAGAEPASGPGVTSPAPRKTGKCAHGYMNPVLCPQCRAAA